MNKTIIVSIGAVVIIGLFILAYSLKSSTTTLAPVTSPSATLPIAGKSNEQSSVITPGVNSTDIQMIDFLKDPATIEDSINPGYYNLGYHTNVGVSDPAATNNPPYIITYISATQYFNIALLQEPIGPMREEAQQYLMARLGISQNQMCQLNYTLSVPNSVNSRYAGESLGFSFCPGATVLPK